MKLAFRRQLSKKKAQISNYIKIRPVGAEMFHAKKQTDGREGQTRTKLAVAFHNFVNEPKKKRGAFTFPSRLYIIIFTCNIQEDDK
jgi:hypothetical protein